MTAVEHDSPRRNATPATIHFQHDWNGDEPLSVAIASTVAELAETDPSDLEVLYDRIDPDALDALFEPSGDAGRDGGLVRFSLSGCEVTVYGDGFTVVRRLDRTTDERPLP